MAEEHNHTFETTEVEDRGLLDFVSKKKEEKADEEVLARVKNLHIKEENLEDEKKHTLLEKLNRSDGSSSGSLSDEDEADEEKKERRKKKGLKEKLNGDYKAEDTVMVTQEAVNVEEPDDSTIVVEKVVTEAVVETPTVLEEEKEECLEEMMEKLKEHKKILEEGAVESIAPAVKEGAVESTAPPPHAPAVELEVEKEECLEEMMEKLQEHKKILEEGALESIAPVVKDGAVESTAPLPPTPVVEPEMEKKSFLAKIKEKLPGYHKSGGEEGEKAVAVSE